MRRWRLPLLVTIFLVGLAPTARSAELADYLKAIGLDTIRAPDSPFRGFRGEDLGIAVIDTGVDASVEAPHVAFGASAGSRLVGGANFAADTPASGPTFADLNGHGTHVASAAVGRRVTLNTEPRIDVAGVAPQADVYAVRVLDEAGRGSFADVVDGLDWVVDQVRHHGSNIRALNMSLGTSTAFTTEPTGGVVDAFNARVATLASMGVPVFAASGNAGSQTGLSFPAIADGVISVGSLAADGSISGFTNHGDALDLLAPGESIWGAVPGSPLGYRQGSGTSFAAPLVSGAALLVSEAYESKHGAWPSVEQVRAFLTASDTLTATSEAGAARLNLDAALGEATAIPEPATIMLVILAAIIAWPGQRRARR